MEKYLNLKVLKGGIEDEKRKNKNLQNSSKD